MYIIFMCPTMVVKPFNWRHPECHEQHMFWFKTKHNVENAETCVLALVAQNGVLASTHNRKLFHLNS